MWNLKLTNFKHKLFLRLGLEWVLMNQSVEDKFFLLWVAQSMQVTLGANSKWSQARELERERGGRERGRSKSQIVINANTWRFVLWGSVPRNPLPVEESTKDRSLSTLSLSQTIMETGWAFFSISGTPSPTRVSTHRIEASCFMVTTMRMWERVRNNQSLNFAALKCASRYVSKNTNRSNAVREWLWMLVDVALNV
jgi:hypothetical protein